MEERSKQIQNMFDEIAPRYDFLNRFLSFRRDVAWREQAVKTAEIKPGMKVLDLACGTGDVSLEIKKQVPGACVISGDFSINMLFIAKEKIQEGLLSAADAHRLPFKDSSFDRMIIAFGFRNVTDKEKALAEFHRVLKKGGRLCILEFAEPENKIFGGIYKFYFKNILPVLGGVISGNRKAYEYLPDSVYKFPKRKEYMKMIKAVWFENVAIKTLMFGAVTIAVAEK